MNLEITNELGTTFFEGLEGKIINMDQYSLEEDTELISHPEFSDGIFFTYDISSCAFRLTAKYYGEDRLVKDLVKLSFKPSDYILHQLDLKFPFELIPQGTRAIKFKNTTVIR